MRLTPPRDPARSLGELRCLDVNYTPGRTNGRAWHHDRVTRALPSEPPGDPVPGGSWEIACALVRDYEFADPRIIRGYWAPHPGRGPAGRDMLLEGRFVVLRFLMGVRVDTEIDETRTATDGAPCRVWGWSYQTLGQHLERGRLVYEVEKNLANGEVSMVITGVSRGARIDNLVVRAGFRVFGRFMQRRFYRGCGRRLERLVVDALDGVDPPTPRAVGDPVGEVVTAPTRRRHAPGRPWSIRRAAPHAVRARRHRAPDRDRRAGGARPGSG